MANQTVRNEIAKLEQLSNAMDALKQQLVAQDKLVTSLVKQQGLTNARFDFGSKSIKYKNVTVPGTVTQDCIKKALHQFYPQLDPVQFLTNAKTFRKSRSVEKMEISRKKKN